jgi:hypothetical protein
VGYRQKIFDDGGGMIKQGDRAQTNYRRSETLPIAPLLLWFLAIFFKDTMDHSSDFRRDDATGLVDLPVTGYDLFYHAFPGSLSAENILPDGVMRDTHFTGCPAIRARSLIGFK